MIIYMGVGIPIVQSRCYQCADKDAALLTVVDISNYGCTCGCGDVGNKNVKSGSGCSCPVSYTHLVGAKKLKLIVE